MSDKAQRILSVADHRRDEAGLTYVYPVVSRRAGGVSVGINLNPNNACNWRCVYCQVPELVRGAAPPIDLPLLCNELAGFLHELRAGDFMRERVPEELRRLQDIAFSGNGEPTTARHFADIVEQVGATREAAGYGNEVPLRLITNGSLISRPAVIRGIETLARFAGEVWFKIDGVSPDELSRINSAARSRERTLRNLRLCAAACPTWVQTCMFAWDGEAPTEEAVTRYVQLLSDARDVDLRGVLLYGVARPSMQPERSRIAQLLPDQLNHIANRIRKETGLTVSVSP